MSSTLTHIARYAGRQGAHSGVTPRPRGSGVVTRTVRRAASGHDAQRGNPGMDLSPDRRPSGRAWGSQKHVNPVWGAAAGKQRVNEMQVPVHLEAGLSSAQVPGVT